MYTSKTSIRVRYSETDQMGCVYYGCYAAYYEVARVDCLRQLGIRYKELEESGIMMPVVKNISRYLKPAFYDDVLCIMTTIQEIPNIKIQFNYEILNDQNDTIHYGETLLAFVNKVTWKPCRTPNFLIQALKSYFV